MKIENIDLKDYMYDLPDDRIAQYPVEKRDMSKLLVYIKGKKINEDIFKNLTSYLPSNSLLVFNNTKVIRARIMFSKESGATIEILCLEPLIPADYAVSLGSFNSVEWKCLVGNLKKWKKGAISTEFSIRNRKHTLFAEKICEEGDAMRIRFKWDSDLAFAEVLEATGHIPLPPYINREDETEDLKRYQTIYSSVKGSVAAPTAGLHFTEDVLKDIDRKGITRAEITLHVGAGTFKPVKSEEIKEHEMHSEHFTVSKETIELLLKSAGNIIAVGTTSVRTLESLYWAGVKILNGFFNYDSELCIGQWEVYGIKSDIPVQDSMRAILDYLSRRNERILKASTSIIIVPGYDFRMINGIITNFHQPKSTLLLLISAWIGPDWKKIYEYAIYNGFRFLSYGDSSLLIH